MHKRWLFIWSNSQYSIDGPYVAFLICYLCFKRDRKNVELELQNARRKETKEMARDLESQLAAVDRTSQVFQAAISA